MLSLKNYESKKVHIVDVSGNSFSGIVGDYVFPDDNEFEEESVILDIENENPMEFYLSDIQSIEIVEE